MHIKYTIHSDQFRSNSNQCSHHVYNTFRSNAYQCAHYEHNSIWDSKQAQSDSKLLKATQNKSNMSRGQGLQKDFESCLKRNAYRFGAKIQM